ncbi:hypothetical protein ACRRTK_019915 [Alexandromys fortis]
MLNNCCKRNMRDLIVNGTNIIDKRNNLFYSSYLNIKKYILYRKPYKLNSDRVLSP